VVQSPGVSLETTFVLEPSACWDRGLHPLPGRWPDLPACGSAKHHPSQRGRRFGFRAHSPPRCRIKRAVIAWQWMASPVTSMPARSHRPSSVRAADLVAALRNGNQAQHQPRSGGTAATTASGRTNDRASLQHARSRHSPRSTIYAVTVPLTTRHHIGCRQPVPELVTLWLWLGFPIRTPWLPAWRAWV
jgi:hypothetical protein